MILTNTSWDPVWEDVFKNNEWGKYPAESLVRFIARNFYNKNRNQIRILEVGCGPGANIWYLSREGFQAYGIDGSETAITRAKNRLTQEGLMADLRVGDVVNLNMFTDGYFDAVIDVECIYGNNQDNAKKIYAEIARVLKKEGLFYSRTFSEKNVYSQESVKISELEYQEIKNGPLQGKGLVRLMDEKSIEEFYNKHFKIISIDLLEFTNYNRTHKVSEYIIIAQK